MVSISNLKIKRLQHGEGLDLPDYATKQSAGFDLRAAILEDSNITIKRGEIMTIPTGISIALEDGFEAQIRPRSGLAAKYGVTVLNTPGTIDTDYRGEIKVILINHGTNDFVVQRGMRIAQCVIARYERVYLNLVQELDDTKRGENGFGSTGY